MGQPGPPKVPLEEDKARIGQGGSRCHRDPTDPLEVIVSNSPSLRAEAGARTAFGDAATPPVRLPDLMLVQREGGTRDAVR